MDPALLAVRRRLLDEHAGEGVWSHHFGDGLGWAAAYLLAQKDLSLAEQDAATATVTRARRLLARLGSKGPGREEAALSVLALVASGRAGSGLDRAAAQAAVTAANAAAAARGGYLDRPASSFDATSVTAGLAYGNLLVAAALRGPPRIVHGRAAEWLLERVEARVATGRGAYLATKPGDNRLHALPNLLAATAYARAARLRRKPKLLARAEALESAVRAALWDGEAGAWLTSEEADPVYLLSVQNFAGLMYAELAAAAPRGPWKERGKQCVAFALKRVRGKDVLHHDWHPETGAATTYCTGCNWQALYVADALDSGKPAL